MKTPSPANIRLTGILVFGALALWFLFALTMSLQGQYLAGPRRPPLVLGLSVFVPIVVFATLYRLSASARAFLHALDPRAVVGLQIGRLLAVDFLIRYAQGQFPAGFALPAGIGDITTALGAVFLVLAMNRKGVTRKQFIAWNLFGLADFMVAVSTGILYSVSTFGILAGSGPTTLLMSEFPRALIPTFLVPFYALLHLLALARTNEISQRLTAAPRLENAVAPA